MSDDYLMEQIEARRNDPAFMSRLARRLEEDKPILDQLANGDTVTPGGRDDLAAMIKNAYYHARDHGGTMHTAADDAADAILAAGWVSPKRARGQISDVS